MRQTRNGTSTLSPWRWFALILLVSLVLKACLLFTSQSYVDGDEAVIGIMAKHIMEKGARPIRMYGSYYMGGAAAEAYLGAVSFRAFGVSSRALRGVGILESTVLLLAVFLFMKKNFDGTSALVAAALLVTSPSFVQWGVKPTSGYVPGMVFTLVMVHGVYRAREKKRIPAQWAAVTGLIGGLALWNHPSSIPAIAATIAAFLLIDIRFPARKEFLIFTACFLIGTAPAMRLHLQFIRQIAEEQGAIAYPVKHFWGTFLYLWTLGFPLIFCPYQEQSAAIVYGRTPLYAWAFYLVFLAAMARTLRSIFTKSERGRSRKGELPSRECILLLYLAVFALSYCAAMRPAVSLSSRYLMPAFPIVLCIMSVFIGGSLSGRKPFSRISALSALLLLLAIGLWVNISFMRKPPEIVASGLVEQPRRGDTIPKTISFLESQDINYVLSMDHLTEWQINFESRERIIACRLDPTLRYQPYARLLYAETVKGSKPYAFVWPRRKMGGKSLLHNAEVSFRLFLEENGVGYTMQIINDEIAVYYGFSRNIAASLLEPLWSGAANVWAGQYPPLPPPRGGSESTD